ncbi:Whole genome shotgun assembly, allelic scaffold old set, scaffold old scaffoldA_2039, related, partial [Eimeria tenella]
HAHWVNTLALNSDAVLRRGPFDNRVQQQAFTSFAEMKEAAEKHFNTFIQECDQEALLSGSDDSTLILRRLKPNGTFEEVGRMTGHQKLINCVCFSPNGLMIASGSFDKLWNGTTGQYMATLRGHVGPVYQLAWAADSRLLLSGSGDSTLKVWDAEQQRLKEDLPGHADEVYAIDWAPNGGAAASGGKDRMLRIWRH